MPVFRVPGRTASGVDSGVSRTRTRPSIREGRHVTIYLPNPDVGPIGSEPGEFIDPSAAEWRDPLPATRKSVGAGNPPGHSLPTPSWSRTEWVTPRLSARTRLAPLNSSRKGRFMSIDTSRHVEERAADPSAPKFVAISSVDAPPVPVAAEAMTVRVTLPPGSPGLPPHRHSGPAFGYVVEGEMIFELEGEPARVVYAGETFWEPGGDVIHYQDGNNLRDTETTFIVVMFCVPDQPMFVPVSPEELEQRRNRRAPRR
jgi:quercetin dioxygenase-like cupin family protein